MRHSTKIIFAFFTGTVDCCWTDGLRCCALIQKFSPSPFFMTFIWKTTSQKYLRLVASCTNRNNIQKTNLPPNYFSFSPQRFVPEVKTGHHMQPDIFMAPSRALQTAINRFAPVVAHSTECTGTLGDVVFEEVDACVRAFPQVGSGHISHAGSFLIVVCNYVVHVGVWVGELLKSSAFCKVVG